MSSRTCGRRSWCKHAPQISSQMKNPVGASLLAMTDFQSTFMLNVSPQSRASSLPQVLCDYQTLWPPKKRISPAEAGL
ncbi:hypothetical protein EMIT0P291_20259 [Pseudomonas sp. IT-P291]